MTRINVVDPKYLTDQHLMAEYRELPMVIGSLKRSLRSTNGLPKIGEKYSLNGGHVKFFYNKGKFLYRRYLALIDELIKRGYNLSIDRNPDWNVFTENNLNNDWIPDKHSLEVNSERIFLRIMMKPHWYKYRGESIVGHGMYNDLVNPKQLWK